MPELRFFAILFSDKDDSFEVLYDDNDLDCEQLKEIMEKYGYD